MKTLTDYPKRILLVRSNIQRQLDIRPLYNCELISTRTLKHKCIEIALDYTEHLNAPSGYRLYRVWNVRTHEEIEL